MLKRKIQVQLEEWKRTRNDKCLVITGARQVGKTYIVRKFSEENYASYIELNFIENPQLANIFRDRLSADSILSAIRLYFPEKEIIPGNTLLLLDEIQECSNAITALKFLAADSRIDVIATGSLLGLRYKGNTSYPVGSVDYLSMHALDFEEFLWAVGVSGEIIEQLRFCFHEKTPVPYAVHSKMMEYLRQYMVTGGMPEVVEKFVTEHDYYAADVIQRRIYRDYLADIARYADPNIKIKAEKCFRSIPLQLSKENHKFQYSVVEHRGNAKKFESSLDWIVNADMAAPVMNVSRVEYPLAAYAIDDNLRLYNTDIGFLICTYDFSLKKALLEDEDFFDSTLANPVLKTAKGGLYEALVADMLIKNGHEDLFFFRNEPGTVELEFLLNSPSGVLPVEVKAGRSGTKSLNSLLKNEDILFGYKLADQNVGIKDKKITLPLYMAMFI
ncbi:MAG: AAA family ATPase [Eubacteriales bacterium]|nr:AAA family ATPase [Eubacteriales bacterium]